LVKDEDKSRGDFAIHALVEEVERRKGKHACGRYSYGKLVADTTPEERERIVERRCAGVRPKSLGTERFEEPDDAEDIRKITDSKT